MPIALPSYLERRLRLSSIILLLVGLNGPAIFGATAGNGGPQLIEISPVTDRILLLHFDEGYVAHHKRGQARTDEVLIANPLDEASADLAASYRLNSPTDPNYKVGQHPVAVARKSKATDYLWLNGGVTNPPGQPAFAKEHWIYLTLPEPLKEGANYALETGSLAAHKNPNLFIFDSTRSRSETIHVNTIGYRPKSRAKYAYLYQWMGSGGILDVRPLVGRPFQVIDIRTHTVAFEGKLAFRGDAKRAETTKISDSPPYGNFAGADVVEADFSSLQRTGAYVVSVPGVGCSFPFEIKADVYRRVFTPVARALYHNRSGIALTQPFTDYVRPAPHNPEQTPGFQDKLFYTSVRFPDWPHGEGSWEDRPLIDANIKGPIESCGWYQDAGDWDSYQQHLNIAQHLLFALEIKPENFKDDELNLPESGNGVPDLLDEARWLPAFCQRLRKELIEKGYNDGGISLRICGDVHGWDVRPDGSTKASYDDVDRKYVVAGADPWSTFRYAGTAAHLGFVLKKLGLKDPDSIDWLKEAREAYEWGLANTKPEDEKREPIYWLFPVRDHRMYAAAGLFRLTGEMRYAEAFMKDFNSMAEVKTFEALPKPELDLNQGSAGLGWENAYGPWVMALGGGPTALPEADRARVEKMVLASAERTGPKATAARNMRFGGPFEFDMLVGHQSTPLVMDSAVAYTILRERDPERAALFWSAIETTADYMLGTNPLHYVWVSGVGPRNVKYPFHMDGWYNNQLSSHPGIVPYGPWRVEQESANDTTNIAWSYRSLYPQTVRQWPGAEQWFENRGSPLAAEFTVHQNIGPAAAIYGLLCAPQK
ncbi:MAG: glycoside hydrolase family 9 protein [Opitutaceae bacterium]|nr:glycoside hydrolase family 9 protein [Opitutaceae bacterium]